MCESSALEDRVWGPTKLKTLLRAALARMNLREGLTVVQPSCMDPDRVASADAALIRSWVGTLERRGWSELCVTAHCEVHKTVIDIGLRGVRGEGFRRHNGVKATYIFGVGNPRHLMKFGWTPIPT